MCEFEMMYYKARLCRKSTGSLLSVEVYEPLNLMEWEMFIAVKFSGWSVLTWLKPVGEAEE